jgi:hypothetical protein
LRVKKYKATAPAPNSNKVFFFTANLLLKDKPQLSLHAHPNAPVNQMWRGAHAAYARAAIPAMNARSRNSRLNRSGNSFLLRHLL